jgi:hypothetical protein
VVCGISNSDTSDAAVLCLLLADRITVLDTESFCLSELCDVLLFSKKNIGMEVTILYHPHREQTMNKDRIIDVPYLRVALKRNSMTMAHKSGA